MSLFVQGRGALRRELTRHLRTGRTLRRPRGARPADGRGRLRDTVSIRERPAEAADRAVPGHWEGDLVVGRGATAVATLVERTTRFVQLVALPAGWWSGAWTGSGARTAAMDAPNAVWSADFKGEFKTRDGVHCYPLTLCNGYSRALLACRGLPSTRTAGAWRVFERLFREHGLPARIRSDNGVPSATIVLGRLSTLTVWWVRLGILPNLIEPSSPQQNGQHERMQRTLKAEACRPARAALGPQQRAFDAFRREYNEEWPHKALGQVPPASRYAPSPRPYPRRLPPVEYSAHWGVRRVSRNGGVRWCDKWVNISHVLAEEYVGFDEIDAGVWNVAFSPLVLGRFDERTLKITDANGYRSRNPRQV